MARPPAGKRFPRRLRVLRREEFRRVFAEGRRISCPEFQIVMNPNDLGDARLGLAVGRAVGDAVTRNRVKRRLREVFRRNYGAVPTAIDVVVVARVPAATASFARLEEMFLGMVSGGGERGGGAGRRGNRTR